jgi:dipeptidyl aminopeptidase/acylaminoacyl peptidase
VVFSTAAVFLAGACPVRAAVVVIPVKGHNPSDPLHREDRTHRWIDWFARHF